MEEQATDTTLNQKEDIPKEEPQESQGVIVEIFKKLLQYNFIGYGTKKDF